MRLNAFCLLVFLATACAGCASSENAITATPNFVTAVLPTPIPPQPTATFEVSTPSSTSAPALAAPVEGITTTQVHIRAQPSAASESLGMLNIFTKVQIVGKDSSGKWYQIIHADSFGWVSAEYTQVSAETEIPVSAAAEPTSTQVSAPPTESIPLAAQDSDSMQAPLAKVVFSPTGARSLQLNGDISAPNGDTEDWVEFASQSGAVQIHVACDGADINMELLGGGAQADNFRLACGGAKIISVTPNAVYHLRLSAPNVNEYRYITYTLYIKDIH